MKNLINKIITLISFFILLSACSASLIVNKYENKLYNELDLNKSQYKQLKAFSDSIKPILNDGIKTYSANKRKWNHMFRKLENLDAAEIIKITDQYNQLYQQNKVNVVTKFTQFYNSLNKKQRKKMSKILTSRRDFRNFFNKEDFQTEENLQIQGQ